MQRNVFIAKAGAVFVLGVLAAPAIAQQQEPDYEAIVRVMRECAKIEDIPARVGCYDNTINAEQLINRSSATQARPDQSAQGAARAPAPTGGAQAPTGFGAASLREPAPPRSAEADEVELVVRQADRLEPGIFVLTLSDGSKWRFVDAVPPSYDAPRAGSRVELARASLGSFQMRYAGQRPVRIRRIE